MTISLLASESSNNTISGSIAPYQEGMIMLLFFLSFLQGWSVETNACQARMEGAAAGSVQSAIEESLIVWEKSFQLVTPIERHSTYSLSLCHRATSSYSMSQDIVVLLLPPLGHCQSQVGDILSAPLGSVLYAHETLNS